MKKIIALLFSCSLLLMKVQAQSTTASPYCAPTYSNGNSSNDYINAVQLGAINNVSGPSSALPNYTYFNNLSCATLSIGVTYNMSVQCGTYFTNNNIYAWIDWNHNNIFDPGEMIGSVLNMSGSQTSTITFTVPVTAFPGNTRMRVREIYGSSVIPDPCNNFNFGETEDYCIFIPPASPIDMATTALIAPTTGCSLSSQEQIIGAFTNVGTDTIYSFKAFYNINGGVQIDSEIVNDTILPLHTYQYTFNTLANLSNLGAETIQLWANTPGDTFALDDSLMANIMNYASLNTFPFIEDFNGSSLNTVARVNVGSSAQSFLTPIAAHTGAGGYLMTGWNTFLFPGYYVAPAAGQEWTTNPGYISSIDYCVDARNLTGGCGLLLKFDLKQSADYDISYSNFRVVINGVQISPTYQPSNLNVSTENDPWVTYTFNLQQYVGTGFNISFQSCCAYDSVYYGYTPDNVFLDNIRIFPHYPVDMATMQILEPKTGCGHSTSDSVKAFFQNWGCNTIAQGATIPFSYQINNGTIITENYTAPQPIHLNDSIYYTFNTTANLSVPGGYSIKVFTGIASDSDHTNDTLIKNIVAQPTISTYPWHEGFENIPVFWLTSTSPTSSSSNAVWQIGNMGFPALGAHGGNNIAVFSSNNGSGSSADLISPCLDFTTLKQPLLRFYFSQYDNFSTQDYILVYASTNAGASYAKVDSINMYNINANYPGYWQQFQTCLNSYAHQPNVKIKFRSNVDFDDIGIDDITILDGTDSTTAVITDDTICTGSTVTINIPYSTPGRTYFLEDNHGNILTAGTKGTSGLISFASPILTKDTIIRVAYNDSIPNSYCESFLADTFIVKVYPYTIANAGPNVSFCSGSSITLNATGGVTYIWSPSVGLSATNIPNPVASNPATTTYVVFVDNQGHCGSYDTIVVSYKIAPIANAGTNKLLCYNGSSTVQIGGGPTGSGGSGFYNYSWTPTNNIIPTIANPNANPSATTTYTVHVNDLNGCKDSSSVIVFVDPQLHKTMTLNNVGCYGGNNGSASILVSGGTPNYTYIWNTGSGSNGTSVINLLPGTYSMYVTDNLGCSIGDTFTITQPPALGALLNTFNTSCGLCNGMIVPVVGGGTPNYTYFWSNGSTNDSLLNACNGTYTVQIIDANGCRMTDSATVTGPNGSSVFSVDAGVSQQVCSGQTALLGGFPTLSGGTLPYTYSWTPTATLNSATLSNPSVTPTTSGYYRVIATDATGCSKTDSVYIVVNPLPISSAGSNLTFCKFASATLGTTPVSGLTYKWSPSTGLSSTIVANPTVNITATLTYVLTVTNTYGCIDSDQVIVTVNPEPLINAGSDVIIFNGNSATLNVVGASTYTWAPPTGLNTTIGSTVIASPNATTSYVVTGTNSFGCTSTDTVVVYVIAPTGIDEISDKINLKIYPNPFIQNANIEFSLSKPQMVTILLFNISGKLETTLVNEKEETGTHTIGIPSEKLIGGNYLLYIKTDDGIVVKKIIKQQ